MSFKSWKDYVEPNKFGSNSSDSARKRSSIKNANMLLQPFTTGNTVVGVTYNKGVILGVDTRGTAKSLMLSGTVEKIYRLHNFIYTTGAGISIDLRQTARITASRMELIALNSNIAYPRVRCANRMIKRHLLRYHGGLMANFLVAGVDRGGPELYSTYMDGCSNKVTYAALGSGGLAANHLLELGWRPHLKESEAYDLVCDAIVAGIDIEMCSGTEVNICILRNDFTKKQQLQPVYLHTRGKRTGENNELQRTPARFIEIVEERVYLPPTSSDNCFFVPWTGSNFVQQATSSDGLEATSSSTGDDEQEATSSSTGDDEQEATSSSTGDDEQENNVSEDMSSSLEN